MTKYLIQEITIDHYEVKSASKPRIVTEDVFEKMKKNLTKVKLGPFSPVYIAHFFDDYGIFYVPLKDENTIVKYGSGFVLWETEVIKD